jgi:hypothetical protein
VSNSPTDCEATPSVALGWSGLYWEESAALFVREMRMWMMRKIRPEGGALQVLAGLPLFVLFAEVASDLLIAA